MRPLIKVRSLPSFYLDTLTLPRCHQDMQSLEIESQTNQTPFTDNFFQAAQGKLAEPQDFLDNADHGFHGAFS